MARPASTWGRRITASVAVIGLGLTACSSSDPDPVGSGRSGDGGGEALFVGLRGSAPTVLRQGRSCDEVLDDFQSFAPAVLRDQFGFNSFDDGGEVFFPTAAPLADQSETDAAASESAPDVAESPELAGTGDGTTSDTNTQEAGIDEPDVVETDGEFVYLVDQDSLVILDGTDAEVLSRTPLAGYGAQVLLSGDRLLAITGGGGYGFPIGGPGIVTDELAIAPDIEPLVDPAGEPVPIPEPLPVDPPSFAAGTVLHLLDVSDRRAPTTIETTELEGQHVSTRVVDGVARVVISSYPQPSALAAAAQSTEPDEAVDVLAAGVDDTVIEDWLPSFRTSTGQNGSTSIEGPIVACDDVLVPEVNAGLAETSILRVDFDEGFDPADTTTIVAEAGTVYASASTLYVAAIRYVSVPAQSDVASEDWSTAIHAFDLRGDGAAPHVGAGEVPGNTLNQYSMSEHDGYLRIATTEGTPWSGTADSESAVRVLRLEGDELIEVGVVGGLGKTETIQSVRFMGPVGYVVTFRQTDPLYVIDLSDPESPQAVGELKIPGFSSYLHPIGDGRLVGIGRDATDDGQDRGLRLSLFDVSDPTDPTQLQTFTAADAYSAAGNDPKSFLWWAPESAVVVPLERYEVTVEDQQGQPIDGVYQVGMAVLDVADSGITERATITADGRYPSRAVVVQGRLWSLFDGGVVTSDFSAPANGTFHPLR